MTKQHWKDFYNEVASEDAQCTGQHKVTTRHILNTINRILVENNHDTVWGFNVWQTLHLQFRGVEPTLQDESNMLLRSAYQIAIRNGKDTNWEAFTNSVRKQLLLDASQSETETDEQTILRSTCTARTYKLRDCQIYADKVGAHLTNE